MALAMRGEIDPGTARVAAALIRVGQPQIALRGRCDLPHWELFSLTGREKSVQIPGDCYGMGSPFADLRGANQGLHVAGTNGKGSVCAMMFAVCTWPEIDCPYLHKHVPRSHLATGTIM